MTTEPKIPTRQRFGPDNRFELAKIPMRFDNGECIGWRIYDVELDSQRPELFIQQATRVDAIKRALQRCSNTELAEYAGFGEDQDLNWDQAYEEALRYAMGTTRAMETA